MHISGIDGDLFGDGFNVYKLPNLVGTTLKRDSPMSTNLFMQDLGVVDAPQQETFENLLCQPDIRIERIVSTGQFSPPGFWYDQPHGEWVVVLKASAGLLFENEPAPRILHPGDFVNIPAHCRHRVAWTDPTMPTIWLAVHYGLTHKKA